MLERRVIKGKRFVFYREKVLQRLNYNVHKTEITEELANKINNLIDYTESICEFKGIVVNEKIKDLNYEDGYILTSNNLRIESKKLSEIYKGIEKISVLAATIGKEPNRIIEEKQKNNLISDAIIIDAIASELVEAFTDYINDILAIENRMFNFYPLMRFSPGYGDLKLNIQKKIIDFLNTEEIGLSCNPDNFILSPEKSITAFIGWKKY